MSTQLVAPDGTILNVERVPHNATHAVVKNGGSKWWQDEWRVLSCHRSQAAAEQAITRYRSGIGYLGFEMYVVEV